MPSIHWRCHCHLFSYTKVKRIHINLTSFHQHKRSPISNFLSVQLHNHVNNNANTYYSLLETCTNLKNLQKIHAHISILGLQQSILLGFKLVKTYAKLGNLEDARKVFDNICERNVLVWNAMFTGYACNGFSEETLNLYFQMQKEGIQPDDFTFSLVLKACAGLLSLQEGRKIHNHIVRSGIEPGVYVVAGLIDMYAKCGSVEDARHVFDKMPQKNLVSWTAMIGGYVQNGDPDAALKFFNQMLMGGVVPNAFTVTNVISACVHLGALQQCKWIHAYVIRSGFLSDFFVETALIDMYAKHNHIEDACQVFDGMPTRDVVSWTAMIDACAQSGYAHKALELFHEMKRVGVKPNSVTLLSVLLACAELGDLSRGKCIHHYVIINGLQSDDSVGNSLVSMYAKCGSVEVALKLFDTMSERDVVSWNAMIGGYAQNGHANDALVFFHQMQLAGMKPDPVTMVSLLSACTHLGALQQGKRIHSYIIRSGFTICVFLGTALIDMYAKCGSIKNAKQVFDRMCEKNVVVWSAMIAGYGVHGSGQDALSLFSQMQLLGPKPNHITFTSVLSACSHAGLVEEGWHYFHCMSQDYSITPQVKQYACMVDLLGRAGHLDEALEFIKRMPVEPDAAVWGALLGACRIHCNIELGEHVADHLFNLQPKDAGYYVLLSNIYAVAGRWDNMEKVRLLMKDRGLKKTPGCSVIELNNRVHAFLIGDTSHPQSEQIYATLQTLTGQMEDLGYIPNTNFVLHDVEEELKEHMLFSHSEKLAIAFGLINTCPGTTIRITKNLRVCGDCHNATKFICRIVKREIVVRDANRFHHFKDGRCSCGDYW